MNSRIRNQVFAAALALLCACNPALYIPTEIDATRTGTTTDRLLSGRTLYIEYCGSCHNLRVPEKFTKKEWIDKLPEMQHKAKISDEETKLITIFLLARSKPE